MAARIAPLVFALVTSQAMVGHAQTGPVGSASPKYFERVTLVQAEANAAQVASPSDTPNQPTPAPKPGANQPTPSPRPAADAGAGNVDPVVRAAEPSPLRITPAPQVGSGCAAACETKVCSGDCDSGCATCNACQACCCPATATWTLSGELLFLDRSQPFSGVIVVDDTNFPAPATTGDNLGFDMEPGPRVTLARRGPGRDGLELVYFGFHNWSASHVNPGNNDRSIPNPLGVATFDYFAADQITVSLSSEIQNGEANYTYVQNDRLTLLGGLRYLSLDETLNLNAVDSNTGTSDYLINARNSLFGGQLGARYRLGDPDSLLNLTVTGKAGVFNNDTKQRTYMRDFNNTLVLRDFTTVDTETSFIGELNFISRILLCDNVNLLAGYNLMWIENLALAPQQLDFTDTPTSGSDLRETSGIFLHGASLGLEVAF